MIQQRQKFNLNQILVRHFSIPQMLILATIQHACHFWHAFVYKANSNMQFIRFIFETYLNQIYFDWLINIERYSVCPTRPHFLKLIPEGD